LTVATLIILNLHRTHKQLRPYETLGGEQITGRWKVHLVLQVKQMNREKPEYSPIEGKTYTLFGTAGSTRAYYETVSMLADKILEKAGDIEAVLVTINRFSSNKNYLRKLFYAGNSESLISTILQMITPYLKQYTENTGEHLKTLPVSKCWDRRLATTREQYHLYMIEIELTNRLNVSGFREADEKIALLPYCLRDFTASCKAAKDGFDYQCRHCSAYCYQHQVTKMLKKHNIEPYIWMSGNMKKLARYVAKEKKTFSVLGIACVPELLWGMRNCRSNNIPVVGFPLNANRCIRWFGEFHPNSVDLAELEKLVSGESV
jgi:hypothetical protein